MQWIHISSYNIFSKVYWLTPTEQSIYLRKNIIWRDMNPLHRLSIINHPWICIKTTLVDVDGDISFTCISIAEYATNINNLFGLLWFYCILVAIIITILILIFLIFEIFMLMIYLYIFIRKSLFHRVINHI